MDLFATLSSIVFDTPESKPATATPIDAVDNGNGATGGHCIVV